MDRNVHFESCTEQFDFLVPVVDTDYETVQDK